MFKILEIYDIPRKLISIINSMYDGSKSCVRVGQEHTNWFYLATVVRQDDVLYPPLYNILLGFIMRKVDLLDCCILWSGGRRLRDLDYDDNICLLANDAEEKKLMVDTVVSNITISKTELMKIKTKYSAHIHICRWFRSQRSYQFCVFGFKYE